MAPANSVTSGTGDPSRLDVLTTITKKKVTSHRFSGHENNEVSEWAINHHGHTPLQEGCSVRRFSLQDQELPMACFQTQIEVVKGKQVDAALPFLSGCSGGTCSCRSLKTTVNRISTYSQL